MSIDAKSEHLYSEDKWKILKKVKNKPEKTCFYCLIVRWSRTRIPYLISDQDRSEAQGSEVKAGEEEKH